MDDNWYILPKIYLQELIVQRMLRRPDLIQLYTFFYECMNGMEPAMLKVLKKLKWIYLNYTTWNMSHCIIWSSFLMNIKVILLSLLNIQLGVDPSFYDLSFMQIQEYPW